MKQNPCRYCALSTKTRYGHKPSHDNECVDCENLKKHVAYLDEHRKFIEGEPITDLTELLQQEWVMWYHQTKHIEVLSLCRYELFCGGLRLERSGKQLEKKARKSKWQRAKTHR